MRESRSYGSVRGVAGDRYPYRDPLARIPGAVIRPLASPCFGFASPRSAQRGTQHACATHVVPN